MTAYTNHGNTSSANRNSGWIPKLNERGCLKLKRMVSKNRGTTAAEVTAELSIHLEDPFSTKMVQCELHKSNIHGRAAIAKPLITETTIIGEKMMWSSYNLDVWWLEICNVVWWVILHIVPNIRLCLCWRKAWNPECLVPTMKHGGRSVMIWAAISWYFAGPVITLHGWITASDYMDILGNQVHAVVQMLFPDNYAVFQDDSSHMHAARNVHSWIEEHEYALEHLPRPAQSSDLNIFKSLWSVSESMMRSRFPLPSSQATTRCSTWRVVHYSPRDYSEHTWICAKKATNY